ncbi:MAG: DM13 domain-containing protein [Rhodocyclaceae bacterium]|nr:DM13 domain-containing protein [Rhodocyclaceae bacterium]
MRRLLPLLTHLLAVLIGFAAGIYVLPILTAQPEPDEAAVTAARAGATYQAAFRRSLAGSDLLHWAEGTVALGPEMIAFNGRVAPGPDYKLYLSPVFVEDEASFERHKLQMVRVGEVRSFGDFVVALPAGVDIERYNTVVIWCETFREFISAARYRPQDDSAAPS